jgi:hypothetical protein
MTARLRLTSLGLVALAVAGCSNGSSGGSSNTAATPPSATDTPSASASGSPSETASPTPSFSSTVSATKVCTTAKLNASLGQSQGAAGSTIVSIVFKNLGKKACTIYGYPGVSFLDPNAKQLGQPADRRGGEQAVVTLGSGDFANAQLRIPDPGNFDPADCNAATSASLKVYPPGETEFLQLNFAMSVCTTEEGRAVVQPVVPGTGG